MTRTTSSRSAKATPKTAAEPDINGTPQTDPSSATISDALEATTWTVDLGGGRYRKVTVFGGRGRVSFSKGLRGDGGEARFYRNETTKAYDAVMTGVFSVTSNRCVVEEVTVPKTTAAKTAAVSHAGHYPVAEEDFGIAPWKSK